MPHADRKKKDGERKDKKMERMRADEKQRHDEAGSPKPSTDQKDIQSFKPGAADDRNSRPETKPR